MLSNSELKTIKEMNRKFLYLLDVQYTGNPYWTKQRRDEFEEFLEKQNNGETLPFQYCTDKIARTMCQFNADTKIVLMGERFVRDVSEILGQDMTMQEINNNFTMVKNRIAKEFAKQLCKVNQNPTQYTEAMIKKSIEKFLKSNQDDELSCFSDILY